jgi:hypothetical protein
MASSGEQGKRRAKHWQSSTRSVGVVEGQYPSPVAELLDIRRVAQNMLFASP